MEQLWQKFKNDILGLILITCALFSTVALFTYHPEDPSLSAYTSFGDVKNASGVFGSYLADALYQTVGIGAWFFVFLMVIWALKVFFSKRQWQTSSEVLFGTLGLFIFVSLLGLYLPNESFFGGNVKASGFIGSHLAVWFGRFLGKLGASVMLWGSFLFLVIFWTEKNLNQILSGPFRFFRILVFSLVKKLSQINKEQPTLKQNTKNAEPSAARAAFVVSPLVAQASATELVRESQSSELKAGLIEASKKMLLAFQPSFLGQGFGFFKKKNKEPYMASNQPKDQNKTFNLFLKIDTKTSNQKNLGSTDSGAESFPSRPSQFHSTEAEGLFDLGKNSSNTDSELTALASIESTDTGDEKEGPEIHETFKGKRNSLSRKAKKQGDWNMPKLHLLDDPPHTRVRVEKEELRKKAELLTDKFKRFNVDGHVVAVKPGPAVTMFEFKPNADVKLSHITSLENDLAIALSSESLRIIAPIPGRDVVGIESSNSQRETVYLKDLLVENEFWSEDVKLPIALGKQASGEPQIVDLRKMPHLLVAGSTGSGKSVFTVSTIVGLLFRHSPETLRMIMIDPKQVDLAAFHSIPHLLMPPIIEPQKAVAALRWAVKEMEKRYRSMSKFGARNVEAFNEKVQTLAAEQIAEHDEINQELERKNKKNDKYYFHKLPYLVIVVEEFGDLMQIDSKNVEQSVVRLAQLARACGIHLMLCMQSPRKEVVTGLIKTNIPGRISFKVASKMDSRIILDEAGAERLLARGDMLFKAPGTDKPARHHGPWLSDPEINRLSEFWSGQSEPEYDPILMRILEAGSDSENSADTANAFDGDEDPLDQDEMYDTVVDYISQLKHVSASHLQTRYKIGYPRAARLIELLEREGVVGPQNGSKPRQVLIRPFE